MRSTAIGVLLGSLAMFAWGMLYWGANPAPYTAWQQTRDDAAAGRAILQHFPVSGTYYLPGLDNDAETRTKLHEHGPVAFVHVTARNGRPEMDPGIFVKGFGHNLAVVLLLAWLMHLAGPALPGYRDRVKLAAVAGLLAALLVDMGDVVWWYLPLQWKLHQALYSFTALLVPGLVLARFVRPAERGAA